MNRIKFYPLAILFAMFAFVACEKDRAFPEWTETGYGAVPRLVQGVNGQLDFDDIDGSGLDFTVEFYDENNGKNVASYSWAVTYGTLGPVNLVTVNSSDFTNNADGLPQVAIDIRFSKILAALGIDENGIVPGQSFDLAATLTKTDGSTFTQNNTSSNLQGQPLFNGLFAIKATVVNVPCFSKLAGTFDASTTVTNQMAGIGWDDCGGLAWTGTVIWEAEHNPDVFNTGVYKVYSIDANGVQHEDMSMGAYYPCYDPSPTGFPLGDLRIQDDCGTMTFIGASQWGEVYTFNSLVVSGADLTIEWVNDYGEGGKVRLTRTDGQNWPTDLKI